MTEVQPAAPALGASARPRQVNWLGWGIAAVIIVGCLLFIEPAEIAAALRELAPLEVAALLVVATLDRLLMGLKWGVLLRAVGVPIRLARAIRIFYQASFTGVFMPSHVGGDLLRGYWVARESGAKRTLVFASLVVERLLGLVSAANWALLGAVVLAVHLLPWHAPLWVGLGVLAAIAGNGLFVLSLSDRAHDLMGRALQRLGRSKVAGLLQSFYDAYAAYSRDRRALLLVGALTLLEHGLQMLLVLGIAISLDVTADPILLLAATTVYLLLLRLPIAPDGWGVSQVTAIGVFGLMGIPAADAFSVSLVVHAMPMLALIPGGLLLLLSGRKAASAAEAEAVRGEAEASAAGPAPVAAGVVVREASGGSA